MKPEPQVRGARRFRADFVAGILDFRAGSLQMPARFLQGFQVGQMKRHVANRLRRRLTVEQCNCDVSVANRDTIFGTITYGGSSGVRWPS